MSAASQVNQFKVGDKVMCASHGVCAVERIVTRPIGEVSKDFYMLRVLQSSVTLMVSVGSEAQSGMRSLATKRDLERVYSILKSPANVRSATWNMRFRGYMDKLRSGAIDEVAEVFRDLSALQRDRDLSYGEKKMLDKAKALLVAEISAATASKGERDE